MSDSGDVSLSGQIWSVEIVPKRFFERIQTSYQCFAIVCKTTCFSGLISPTQHLSLLKASIPPPSHESYSKTIAKLFPSAQNVLPQLPLVKFYLPSRTQLKEHFLSECVRQFSPADPVKVPFCHRALSQFVTQYLVANYYLVLGCALFTVRLFVMLYDNPMHLEEDLAHDRYQKTTGIKTISESINA